jgi:hypothetical protein
VTAQPVDTDAVGVEANAQLTGITGALLFVTLAVEGLTVLRVHDLLKPHVFLGMVIGALVCLTLGSTGYRFARYYAGDPAYVRKGAPHPILRVIGPFVALTSIAVVVTGVVLVRGGRSARDPWLTLHKASFIVWFALMTIHVLGHLRDTAVLSSRELAVEPTGTVPGRGARIALVALTVAIGTGAGLIALDWASVWPR